MGRPKKTNTDEMVELVEKYFEEEASGNTAMLKCSLLEKYAAKEGMTAKAYDFRRDDTVRKRMEELMEAAELGVERQAAIAYKTLDVDGLLNTCSNLQELKNNLIEVDGYWKSIYEVAANLKVQNQTLLSEKMNLESQVRELTAKTNSLNENLIGETKTINRQQREIRYLKRMLETYLYPALANELLRQAQLPSKENESINPKAIGDLIDGKIPAPFGGMQDNKPRAMTRQEKLMEQMKEQVCRDGK